MKFPIIPGDVPLPYPPTMGLPQDVIFGAFQFLLVGTWVLHILFINVLLGSALASVYYNWRGAKEKNLALDRLGYLLTTPVTICENMGALWGVAPLLIISVLFTPMFYAASIMNSPHWLWIVYGNMVAFLLSYLYKYSWHALENRKKLHIALGVIAVLLFFTLPPVFMATVQLYMTPSTWTYSTRFFDALLRADTLFRLTHFFLATFAVTGVFMLVYGYYLRQREGLDHEAGIKLTRLGKNWFLVPTMLNIVVGILSLFQFPGYGIEAFFTNGWWITIVISAVLVTYLFSTLLRNFLNDDLSKKAVWTIAIVMFALVSSEATLRHGMRISLIGPAMELSKAKTAKFMEESQAATEEAQNAPVAVAEGPVGRQLAEKNGCLACHNESARVVGPAYRDVAAKGYSVEKIRSLIAKPVPSNWPGYGEMPPMQVPDDEAKQIAEWINSLK